MNNKENITNLLPQRPVHVKKDKRHVSMHHNKVTALTTINKQKNGIMGATNPYVRGPLEFLKKGERNEIREAVRQRNYHIAEDARHFNCQHKPTVPKENIRSFPYIGCNQTAISNIHTPRPPKRSKDFIQINKRKALLLKPPQRRPRSVSNTRGDCEDLINAGKLPVYIYKKNFGQIPRYLSKSAMYLNNICDSEEEQDVDSDAKDENSSRCLSNDERNELLKGLRENIKQYHTVLQSLPVVCETREHQKKRDFTEKRIEELDRYIFLLTNYKICVNENDVFDVEVKTI